MKVKLLNTMSRSKIAVKSLMKMIVLMVTLMMHGYQDYDGVDGKQLGVGWIEWTASYSFSWYRYRKKSL